MHVTTHLRRLAFLVTLLAVGCSSPEAQKQRHVERSGIFFRLNGHHLLHHRYMHKNFNVVLPLADLLLGTLLLRSKVRFPQARGESVPDVQPKLLKAA